MPPVPFRIVFLSQEVDRPEAVTAALDLVPLPGTHPVEIRGWSIGNLTPHHEGVAAALLAADVVVLSHVLMEDGAALAGMLLDRHLRPDAQVLVLNCLGPLMSRTRLGTFRLGDGSGTLRLGALSRFVPANTASGDLTETFRSLIEQAPRVLAALPPHLRDMRVFLTAYQYWTAPSPENLRGLVLLLADHYGPAAGTWGDLYGPPETFPKVALYHPVCGIVERTEDLPATGGPEGPIGLLVMRGAVISGSTRAVDAMISRLEAAGFGVIAAFAESFDFRDAVTRYFDPAGVCAVVSMTGFPLVGGHNRCAPDEVASFLVARDALYITAPALMTQSEAAWTRSGLGLSPMELAMQTAIHELEGGIEPLVIQSFAGTEEGAAKEIIAERADRLVARIKGWRRLQTTQNADKRVLLTLFSFPPGKGSVGTAAYLDVFRSAWTILERLRGEGYTVEVPESADALLRMVVEGDDPFAPITSAGLASGERLDVATYERIAPQSRAAEKMWGPAPGSLNTDGDHLIIHGVRLGNVFVGVQPSFGFEGDPMQLLFDRGATPHHGFIAYYAWAEKVFGAHAVVHLGTHGALEFMPGKQAGLSRRCWPDILIGHLPNVYLYSVNNPSEGTIAKRRGSAIAIGHLTPPAERSGLYRDLLALQDLVSAYREDDAPARRIQILESLRARVADAHLEAELPPLPDDLDDDGAPWIGALSVALAEIAQRRIPVGLHTIGRLPDLAEKVEILAARAQGDEDVGLVAAILRGQGLDPVDIERRARNRDPGAVQALGTIEDTIRDVARRLLDAGPDAAEHTLREREPGLAVAPPRLDTDAAPCVDLEGAPPPDPDEVHHLVAELHHVAKDLDRSDELTPLVTALRGGYVPPGPGGDPGRHPGVLPVGRNLHALDPGSIPSETAWTLGGRAVEALLERHVKEHGRIPGHLGFVLWGLDNIKTHGEAIAQVFHLLGARPVRNSIGRVARTEAIPLAELGRPRIDVTVTVSGIFRDIFGLQMELLDRAIRLVADLDEPPEMNPIRARVHALRARGFSRDESTSRIFSNAPGAYGTYIDYMVNLSRWESRQDLAASFLRRKGFTFGKDSAGTDGRHVLQALAEDIEVTVQNLDSAEVSLTDVDHYFEYLGGLTALVESASGQRPPARVLDATSGRLRVRSLEETLRLETRARLLNPKWTEGLLRHGYEGAEEIRKRVEYTFGFSATADAVDPWIYTELHSTYLKDASVRDRLRDANVHAFNALVHRLSEAAERNFWSPTDDEHALMTSLQDALEDAIEGVG